MRVASSLAVFAATLTVNTVVQAAPLSDSGVPAHAPSPSPCVDSPSGSSEVLAPPESSSARHSPRRVRRPRAHP
ncbi:hypothetical protein GY45DRAFT_1324584 [Cubamyces sp. BRFM 1775]|nr:hypothetical protein GY45DRAFT_1324584 [Cubamyces sp. BRFM 1775]